MSDPPEDLTLEVTVGGRITEPNARRKTYPKGQHRGSRIDLYLRTGRMVG